MDRTSWAVYNPHNKSLEDLPIIILARNEPLDANVSGVTLCVV